MGKRRVKRKRKSSGSSGRSGGSWKKSKGLAIGLIVAIIAIWIWMFMRLLGTGGERPALLKDFPYTYMTETSRTEVIIRADSDQQPKLPFKHEKTGELAWECYVCNNESCPGRAITDGKPYKFPYVIEYLKKVHLGEIDPEEEGKEGDMAEEIMGEMPTCPECEEAGLDPYMVTRYQTEEGKKKLAEWRKRFAEERKKNE